MNWDPRAGEQQFQTPPPICRYMASLVPKNSRLILEPTPGEGNLVRELDFYNVVAPNDFFLLDYSIWFDCVVMNPPFSSKQAHMVNAPPALDGMRFGYYVLNCCMMMSDHIIALMPWFTIIDSDVRLRELQKWGLKSVTALPRKTFNYTRIQTCVLELHKGYKSATQFKVFNY